MEEKWRQSKNEKEDSHKASSSYSRSLSTKNIGSSSSSKGQPLKRSSSLKTFNQSSKSSLTRSSSLKTSPPSDSPPYSQKGSSLTRKYTNIAKEQKTRFYIMRRCVAMLVCWHKHGEP